MIAQISALLLGAATLTSALPAPVEKRVVASLNQAAFQEAHPRDNTATRAFSAVEIKTSSGQCLFVDELSGDFRANLNPIQIANCNGATGQLWDIITAGVHNDQPGNMLIVNTLTQACANFDPRRAAGNQVLTFSCGGRADGAGQVTNSQLFPFAGGAGPLAISPSNQAGSCFTVKGSVIDIASCNKADPNQSFTFGNGGAAAAAPAAAKSSAPAKAVATTAKAAAAQPQVTTAPAAQGQGAILSTNPTTPVPVSRAGGTLNPSAAAESNQRDGTATRAFSSVSLKSADGQCLFIDPTAGDFRQLLIPVALKPCTGSPNEKFDIITAGKHNNAPNSALIVSSLTQGCLNFDDRRAAGDTVIIFSCGGRADGQGQVTNSQLFTFQNGEKSLTLQPENGNGKICLVPNAAGRLDQAACSGAASQGFTIV